MLIVTQELPSFIQSCADSDACYHAAYREVSTKAEELSYSQKCCLVKELQEQIEKFEARQKAMR